MQAIARAIAGTLNFHGQTSRRDYGIYALIWLASLVAASAITEFGQVGIWAEGAVIAATSLIAAPMLALTSRRLHDAGWSGIWALLFFVFSFPVVVLVGFLPKREPSRARPRPFLRHRLAAILVIVVAAFGVSRLYWAPLSVTSPSMAPTLLAGDYIIVTRGLPAAGDVAAYELRRENGDVTQYVARAVGMPGDLIGMLEGAVLLNGAFVDQFTTGPYENPDAIWEPGGFCSAAVECTMIEEVLPNGVAYQTLDAGNIAQLDTTIPRLIPEDGFYLLGDHRDNSLDSRLDRDAGGHGIISKDEVVGVVHRIAVSAWRGHWLDPSAWRRDRFWKDISQ